VDIDPGAIEIAKLRLWLSLVVDEDDYTSIQPLPNLDYKIMQGNSLIEEFHGISLDIEKKSEQKNLFAGGSDLDMLIDDLHRKQDDFFNAEHPREKKKKRVEVESAILNIFHNELGKNTGLAGSEKKKIEIELKEITHGNMERNFFPWKLYFADVFREKGGFDVVIANPPYNKERDNKELFLPIRESNYSKYCQSKMDFWFLFLHRSIDIGIDNSRICFITSRYWIQNEGASKIINRIKDEISFVEVVDIGKIKVFDNVVGQHIIALYSKDDSYEGPINYYKVTDDVSNIDQKNRLYYKQLNVKDIFTDDGMITFDPSKINFSCDNCLSDYFEVSQGVVQNPDKVSKKMGQKYNLPIGDGVFVIDEITLKQLNLSKVEKKFLGPFYDEHQIDRYFVKPSNQLLFYLNRINCKSIGQYPNIKNHLSMYKNIMLNRRETLNGTNKYFHLHWPRDKKYFEGNKVIVPAMNKRVTAALQNELGYFGISSNVIISKKNDLKELKILVGILNSNLCQYYFLKNSKKRGVGMDIGVKKIRNFPLPILHTVDNRIIANINQILTTKKANPQADTNALETKIDQLVYDLYGLTEEEIAIVEEGVSG